jgi:hypothetical protein
LHAEFLEDHAGGAGDAGVQDVADDEDLFAGGIGEFLLDGEGVEQRLGRVGVGAVAGVDDGGLGEAGDGAGQAGGLVADDDKSVRIACRVSTVSLPTRPW